MSLQNLVEKVHTGEHVLSEAEGCLSRDEITIANGAGVLPAGQVLGKLTANGKYVAYNKTATDGRETAVGALYAEVDASDQDSPAVMHCRACELIGELLTGLTPEAEADLAKTMVIVR